MSHEHLKEANQIIPLTILVPIRNGMEFLQSFKNNLSLVARKSDQIILVDDQSEDLTFEFISNWSTQDSRVLALQNPSGGLVSALNFGLAHAKYDWIARFDVDDVYSANRLDIQCKEIESDVSAIFCDYNFIGIKSENLGNAYSPIFHDACVLSLINNQRTPHPGAIFNRTKAMKVGSYRKEDFPAEDLSLWLRLSQVGRIVSTPNVLLQYRINPRSVTARNRTLVLEKKSRITSENSALRASYYESIASFRKILSMYDGYARGPQRKALHILELISASRSYGGQIRLLKCLVTQVTPLEYIQMMIVSLSMYRQKSIRGNYRSKP